MLHRLAELIPGLLKRLQIRAQIIAVKKRNMFVAAHAFSAVVLSPPLFRPKVQKRGKEGAVIAEWGTGMGGGVGAKEDDRKKGWAFFLMYPLYCY